MTGAGQADQPTAFFLVVCATRKFLLASMCDVEKVECENVLNNVFITLAREALMMMERVWQL